MFTEVVKLTPQVDRSGLNAMFNNLNSRFTSVAKKFGDGLKNAFKFGGIIGIVSALVQKLLNPLEKAEEIINRIIDKGDDAVTNAEEFGTTPGKLLRFQALAQSHGVPPDVFNTLLEKFQSALNKEKDIQEAPARIEQKLTTEQDPVQRSVLEVQLKQAKAAKAEGGVLHNFIDEKDMSDAFFKFLLSMQKLTKPQQTVIQGQVFGEKIRGKAFELFNATDFTEVLRTFPDAVKLDIAARKAGALADKRDLDTAIRDLNDFLKKSTEVTPGQIAAIDQSAKNSNASDDETLKRFENAKRLQDNMDRLLNKADRAFTQLSDVLMPKVLSAAEGLNKFVTRFGPNKKQFSDAIDTGLGFVGKAADVTGTAVGGAASFVANLPETAANGANLNFGSVPDMQLKPAPQDSELGLKLDKIVNTIETIWSEIKTSRPFRLFGGG